MTRRRRRRKEEGGGRRRYTEELPRGGRVRETHNDYVKRTTETGALMN